MDTQKDLDKTSVGIEIDEIRTIDALESRTYSERFLRFNPEFTLFRKGVSLGVHFDTLAW